MPHPARPPARSLQSSPDWKADLIAGATNSLSTIPDGLASAVLAGVDPVSGLYALMTGTTVGSFFTGAEFMIISCTTALAVATGSILADISPEQRPAALVVLTVMAGLIQLGLGVLKQGSLVRFVSNAVMTGFLTGIALTIVLGQLGDLTGYRSTAGNKITQTLDLLLHLGQIDGATTLVGALTLGLVLLLNRTKLATYGMAVALVIMTGVVALWQPASVPLIRDISPIPQTFPRPVLPDLSLVPGLAVGALSIALLGLIQGAGISKTVPNANGQYADVSQDFSAQGVANITAGLFRGMPIGASLAGTAFSLSVGAKSRWAGVLTGVATIAIALLLAKGVERIPQPAIAALLVLAGLQLLIAKLDGARDVWQTGWASRLIMLVTLIATLLLPIQQAVLLGVGLSVLAYLYKSSLDIEVKELVVEPLGLGAREQAAPRSLPAHAITILTIYGSVFYASTDTLQRLLPAAQTADHAVVILSLRGRRDVGSTFLKLLERYASELTARHSKLLLVGVSPEVMEQLHKTGVVDDFIPQADLFPATDVIGGAMLQAYQVGQAWLQGSLSS